MSPRTYGIALAILAIIVVAGAMTAFEQVFFLVPGIRFAGNGCRRGRAIHNLIPWDPAGSAVIPRLRREGPDARLVVTSAGRILSECGGCGQCGHSQSNNEGFARSHNDPFLSKVELTLSCYCWILIILFSLSHLMSVCFRRMQPKTIAISGSIERR